MFYNRSHTTSNRRGPKLSTPDPAPYASEKNEAPEYNIASNDGAPASLYLLDPNPVVLELSDDIWMVFIPGVDQNPNLLQDLTLSDYLASDNLSIEIGVDEDTEGAQKYEFPNRTKSIDNIAS